MLTDQKEKFNLEPGHTYLNCATMSPQLRSVEEIGIRHLVRKSNPYDITSVDFFTERALLKERFAQLISAPGLENISIIPSVSYGLASVVKNIDFEAGDEIVLTEAQFPSNYYAWKALEAEKQVVIKVVKAPPLTQGRASLWNKAVLDAIHEKTKVVSLPQVHWADGTLFDLKAIRKKAHSEGALLIVDGTQSIGAMPFSVEEIRPDALICGGYKWLMGAYGLGLAYFGEYFFDGTPIENNWINHKGSEDFSRLVHYNPEFKTGAARYDMGESSTFILTPMLSEGIRQILEWTPELIQEHCARITGDRLNKLRESGYFVEEADGRANHMFGIYGTKDLDQLKSRLLENKIHVSFRGEAVRVSPHLYNDERDIEKLITCFT